MSILLSVLSIAVLTLGQVLKPPEQQGGVPSRWDPSQLSQISHLLDQLVSIRDEEMRALSATTYRFFCEDVCILLAACLL